MHNTFPAHARLPGKFPLPTFLQTRKPKQRITMISSTLTSTTHRAWFRTGTWPCRRLRSGKELGPDQLIA